MYPMYPFIDAICSRLLVCDQGQDLIEYAMLASLIAVVCIVALTALGGTVSPTFNAIAAAL